jgi:hypothetical protein
MAELFSVPEARAALVELRPLLDEFVRVRADTAELAGAVRASEPTSLGGLPELKAAEARLNELLSQLGTHDVEVKGVAPLLLDWPSVLDGVPVLLCWLEGEPDVAWFHRLELGFLGRRPLPPEFGG